MLIVHRTLGERGRYGATTRDLMIIPNDWRTAKIVSFGDIRRRIDSATLEERSVLLCFIHQNVDRIRPTIDAEWLYDAMSSYFLECIALRPNSDDQSNAEPVHSPFEAARELVKWFDWYAKQVDDPKNAIGRIVDRITLVFKNGDQSIRNCIETGFLEHVLEIPAHRDYFYHWAGDATLAESYTEALRWGLDHTRNDAP